MTQYCQFFARFFPDNRFADKLIQTGGMKVHFQWLKRRVLTVCFNQILGELIWRAADTDAGGEVDFIGGNDFRFVFFFHTFNSSTQENNINFVLKTVAEAYL